MRRGLHFASVVMTALVGVYVFFVVMILLAAVAENATITPRQTLRLAVTWPYMLLTAQDE